MWLLYGLFYNELDWMCEFYLFWQLYGEMANQQASVMQCCDTFTSVVSLQAKQKCLYH